MGCQETSHDFIPWFLIFPTLRTSPISSDQTWHPCREGFTFCTDYGCLISKGRLMMQVFNGSIHVTQSKQFQGSAHYGNLGMYVLIFWSTKVILKWPLKLSKNWGVKSRHIREVEMWLWSLELVKKKRGLRQNKQANIWKFSYVKWLLAKKSRGKKIKSNILSKHWDSMFEMKPFSCYKISISVQDIWSLYAPHISAVITPPSASLAHESQRYRRKKVGWLGH